MKHNKISALNWCLLTLALFVLLMPGIFLRDFWTYQEGRRALVALETLMRGNWLVPRLMGSPFFTKPPFYYWLQAATFTVIGPADWASRLPSVLAAIVGVLGFTRLLEGLLGGASALCGAAALALSPIYFWMAQTAEPEMVFASLCIVAMMCFGRILALGRRSWIWEAAFYATLALSVLIKGLLCPAMVLLTLQTWQVLRRRRPGLLRIPPLAGFLIILLPLLAWIGLIRLSGYSLSQLFHEAAAHAVEKTVHTRPFFFYFKELGKIMFPWGLVALAALAFVLVAAMRRNGRAQLLAWFRQDQGERLLLTLWFTISILLLSAVSSKKPYYAVGLAAPTAGIWALLYHDWIDQPNDRLTEFLRRHKGWIISLLCGLGTVLAIAAIAANCPPKWKPLSGEKWPDQKIILGWGATWFLGLAGVALLFSQRSRVAWAGRAATAWTFVSLFIMANVYTFVIHLEMNPKLSMELMTRELLTHIPAGVHVATLRDTCAVCFYLKRPDLATIEHLQDLKPFLLHHRGAVVLATGEFRDDLLKLGGLEFLFVPDSFSDKDARVYLVGLHGNP